MIGWFCHESIEIIVIVINHSWPVILGWQITGSGGLVICQYECCLWLAYFACCEEYSMIAINQNFWVSFIRARPMTYPLYSNHLTSEFLHEICFLQVDPPNLQGKFLPVSPEMKNSSTNIGRIAMHSFTLDRNESIIFDSCVINILVCLYFDQWEQGLRLWYNWNVGVTFYVKCTSLEIDTVLCGISVLLETKALARTSHARHFDG